MPKLDSKF